MNKLIKLIGLTGALLWFSFPMHAFEEKDTVSILKKTLIIKGSNSYKPFEFVNKEGRPDGFNVELIRALMKEIGVNYTLELEPLPQLLDDAQHCRIDMVAGLIPSGERSKILTFGLPVCYVNRSIITLKNSPYTTLASLNGKRILVQKGGWTNRYLKSNPITDKIIELPDIYDCVMALKKGEGDAILGNDHVVFYAAQQAGMTDELTFYSMGIDPQIYSFAVVDGNEELIFYLNRALQKLRASGEYNRIYNKWFISSEERMTPLQIILIILATIILLSALYTTYKFRKRALMARRKLKESYKEMQLAFEAGKITAWIYNPKTRSISAVSKSQIFKGEGSLDDLKRLVDAEDFKKCEASLLAILKGSSTRESVEFKLKQVDASKNIRHFESHMMPVDETDDHPRLVVGTLKDITKDVETQDLLISMRDKAEASNRLKSAFLANMSHEIRTPLNAIVGFSDLICNSGNEVTEDEKNFYKDIISKNSDHLLKLINDILDLSKIEAGSFSFTYESFDFVESFKAQHAALQLRAPEGVKLICESPFNHLYIYSDRSRLTQVITNFVTNAFKFTTKGSVTMSYTYENEDLYIAVTDTGTGIAKEKQEKVFERFVKLNDFVQGTGLGLSISKAITEAMGGTIGLTSEEGKGSTFYIHLPCQLCPQSDIEKIADVDETLKTKTLYQNIFRDFEQPKKTNDHRKSILVAEDNDANYQLVYTMMRRDYRIFRATNGAEAIEQTKVLDPDYILMDMKMPIMGGLEATRHIREFNKKVKIVALTAYVLDTNREKALESGCNEFLIKPIFENNLREALEKDYGKTLEQ